MEPEAPDGDLVAVVERAHVNARAVHEDAVRILDDRSLNGVFVNGARVDMRELEDGDQVAIGRFNLHFISLREGDSEPAPESLDSATVG